MENRCIETATGLIAYDHLILAPGGETNFFGLDSVARYGIGMKNLDDSIAIRNHILNMINWAQDYIFYDRAERLITPDGNTCTQDRPWPEENVVVKEQEP